MKKSTNTVIKIFAFVLVFFSVTSKYKYGVDSTTFHDVGNFFHVGFIHAKFFSLFEIILLVLLLNLINNYKVKLKFGNALFLFAFLAYLSRMINPNTSGPSLILGMPLLTNISEYVFLLMILVLVSIPASLAKAFLERFFKDVMIFSIVRSIILIFIYFFGTVTMRWGTYAVILDEGDTQFLFSFLGAMMFPFYLLTGNRKYLLFSILLLGIPFLSGQRSTALPGFIAVFFLILLTLVKAIPLAAKKSFIIVSISILILSVVMIQFPDSKLSFAMNRFAGITKTREEVENKAFSDTGHREQAILTFISAWKESPFFGAGYGNFSDVYLEGQTDYIHNGYAGMWVKNGIVSLLFYLYILGLLLSNTRKLVYKTNRQNYRNYLFRLTVSFYLIGYFGAAWVTAFGTLDTIRFQVFWFFLLIYIIRFPEISTQNKLQQTRIMNK